MDSKFAVQFELVLGWYDPGLTFVNLKEDSHKNQLSGEMKDKIWKPQVPYCRTQYIIRTTRFQLICKSFFIQIEFSDTAPLRGSEDDERNFIRVERMGHHTHSQRGPLNEYLFEGRANRLIVSGLMLLGEVIF